MNEQAKKYLEKVEKEAEFKSLVHSKTGNRYSKYNKWLGYPIAFLNAIAGSATVSALYTLDSDSDLFLALGCLNICTAIVSTMHNIAKYGEYCQKHYALSRLFSNMQRKISYFLSRENLDKKYVDTFCENIKYRMNNLIDVDLSCPQDIENSIRKLMNSKTKTSLSKDFCKIQASNMKNDYNSQIFSLLDEMNISDLKKITKYFIEKEKKYSGKSYILEINVDKMDKKQIYQYLILELNIGLEHLQETISKYKHKQISEEVSEEDKPKEQDEATYVEVNIDNDDNKDFDNFDDEYYIQRSLKRNKWKKSTLKFI